jgi:hypothetical protein
MGGEVLTFLIEPDTIAESGVPTISVSSHHRLFDSSLLMHSNICEYAGVSYEGSKLSINWSIISCEMLTSERDGLTSQILFSEPNRLNHKLVLLCATISSYSKDLQAVIQIKECFLPNS